MIQEREAQAVEMVLDYLRTAPGPRASMSSSTVPEPSSRRHRRRRDRGSGHARSVDIVGAGIRAAPRARRGSRARARRARRRCRARRRTAAGRAGRRRGAAARCQPTSAPSAKASGSSIGPHCVLEAHQRGELRLLARQRPVGVAEAIARPAQAVEAGGLRRRGLAELGQRLGLDRRAARRPGSRSARRAPPAACRSASAIAASYWPVPSASAARCTPAWAVRRSSAPKLVAEERVGLGEVAAPPPPGRGAG